MTTKVFKCFSLITMALGSTTIVLSVYGRAMLPVSYFVGFLLVALGAILIIRATESTRQRSLLLMGVVTFSIFLRATYSIYTGFNALPLRDSYADYATTRMIMGNGFIPDAETRGALPTNINSLWPLIHLLASALAQASGLDLLFVTGFLIPTFSALASLLFCYLFVSFLSRRVHFSLSAIALAIFIYVISPEVIWIDVQFHRATIAQPLVYATLYFAARVGMGDKDRKRSLVLLLFSVALVLSHITSSLAISVYLLIVVAYWSAYGLFTKTQGNRVRSLGRIAIIFLTGLLIWWIFHAVIAVTITSYYVPNLNALLHFDLKGIMLERTIQTSGERYALLSPPGLIVLLRLRDVILYTPLVGGFLILIVSMFRRTSKKYLSMYLSSSIIAIASFATVYMNVTKSWIRVLTLFAPFFTLISAIFFDRVFRKARYAKGVVYLCLILAAVIASFAPFSHNYAPLYIYEPAYESKIDHNFRSLTLSNLFRNETLSSVPIITSDDVRWLYVILPVQLYEKIQWPKQSLPEDGLLLFDFLGETSFINHSRLENKVIDFGLCNVTLLNSSPDT